MDKRLITERQEEALRLCHHDFGGLTQEEAAKIMEISQSAINDLLNRVKKVAPQLFPILTKHEFKIYNYYMKKNWRVIEIAEHLNLTKSAIYAALARANRKGMIFPSAIGRIEFIEEIGEEEVDFRVKHKF